MSMSVFHVGWILGRGGFVRGFIFVFSLSVGASGCVAWRWEKKGERRFLRDMRDALGNDPMMSMCGRSCSLLR